MFLIPTENNKYYFFQMFELDCWCPPVSVNVRALYVGEMENVSAQVFAFVF